GAEHQRLVARMEHLGDGLEPLDGDAVLPVRERHAISPPSASVSSSSPLIGANSTSPTAAVALRASPLRNTSAFWCVLPSLRETSNCLAILIGKVPAAVIRMASL